MPASRFPLDVLGSILQFVPQNKCFYIPIEPAAVPDNEDCIPTHFLLKRIEPLRAVLTSQRFLPHLALAHYPFTTFVGRRAHMEQVLTNPNAMANRSQTTTYVHAFVSPFCLLLCLTFLSL